MQKRLGVVGIVVEDTSAALEINTILHESAGIIIGRMGIPHRERGCPCSRSSSMAAPTRSAP